MASLLQVLVVLITVTLASASRVPDVLAVNGTEGRRLQQYTSWYTGRSTFYGTDGWSVNTGSCGYGKQSVTPNAKCPTGYDVGAMSDKFPWYKGQRGPSCGMCIEIRCKPMVFKDGFGATLDRRNVCRNSAQSVVIRNIDTCQCVYPGNAVSNKRWCCGDMAHIDLSIWAFEKLADTKWGVIATEYRRVPCSYKPAKPAPRPKVWTPYQ